MKKTLILAVVLMLVAAGMVYAAGTVVGSKHDMTSAGAPAGGPKSSNLDEVCAFCHTPHGTTSTSAAPLWNRTSSTATLTDYTSSTLNGTSVHTNDMSAVCISCHDGNVGDETLINIPNAVASVTWTASLYTGLGNLADGTQGLKNDHPIGIAVNTVGDPNIVAVATIRANTGVKLYGGSTNLVECASCHNVHDNSYVPFLRSSNAGSDMCLICHLK